MNKITLQYLLVIITILLPRLVMSQPEMTIEADSEFRVADSTMNYLYKRILKETGEFKELRVAQRAWLAFRDAQVESVFPNPDPRKDGDIIGFCVENLRTSLTRDRIKQLRWWVDGTAEGDVCPGTYPVYGDDRGDSIRAIWENRQHIQDAIESPEVLTVLTASLRSKEEPNVDTASVHRRIQELIEK